MELFQMILPIKKWILSLILNQTFQKLEGGYWSADKWLYLDPMTRSRTKRKTLAKANALMEEHFSTEKDVNVDINWSLYIVRKKCSDFLLLNAASY